MKANVCFIIYSFDFDGTEEALTESVSCASSFVAKMNSNFIKFSKSNDFYDKLVEEIYCPNKFIEVGALSSAFYDGPISKATQIDLNSNEIIECVNNNSPEYEQCWMSIYGNMPSTIHIVDSERVIINRKDLINYSKSIVQANKYNADDYAEVFVGVFRNLIFHPNFNSIAKIEGGCNNFINGIFEMFDVMNSYTPTGGDPKEALDYINSKIKFTTCEEGGAKKRRKTEENKLHFLFEIDSRKQKYNCEYHCKLEYKDSQYKNGEYHRGNRMYFGFYKSESPEKNNKFLIAHLGDHL